MHILIVWRKKLGHKIRLCPEKIEKNTYNTWYVIEDTQTNKKDVFGINVFFLVIKPMVFSVTRSLMYVCPKDALHFRPVILSFPFFVLIWFLFHKYNARLVLICVRCFSSAQRQTVQHRSLSYEDIFGRFSNLIIYNTVFSVLDGSCYRKKAELFHSIPLFFVRSA